MEQTNGNDWGYSLNYKWIEGFLFEGSPQFTGMIPTYDLVDAQVNLKVPGVLSNIKIGATNLLGDEYFTAFGTGFIGSQYYVSWIINNF